MANVLFSISSNCGEGFFRKTLRLQYIYCSDINVVNAYGGPGLSSKWYASSFDSIWSQAILITDQQFSWFRLLSSSKFSIYSISPPDFLSFARQFLHRGVYRLIVFHWSQSCQDNFRLVLSPIMSNCFHPLGNKTLFLKHSSIRCK